MHIEYNIKLYWCNRLYLRFKHKITDAGYDLDLEDKWWDDKSCYFESAEELDISSEIIHMVSNYVCYRGAWIVGNHWRSH